MPKTKAKSETEEIINNEVEEIFALQKQLSEVESELMHNEKFKEFLALQRTIPAQIEAVWDKVEEEMIKYNVKSLKGDWGSLTITERLGFEIDKESLPPRFWKKVPDEKKIRDTYRLEGKPPKGTEPKTTKFLTKRIKEIL